MATANGSQFEIAFQPETTWGVTPATLTLKKSRITSCNLQFARGNMQSSEIRSDRQVAGFRLGTHQVTGGFNIELAYGSWMNDLLQGALFGTWNGTTNTLKAGTTTRYYTLEKRFTDVTLYHRFTGNIVNSFSLSLSPDAIVTGTFDFMGKTMTTAATILGAATAATEYEMMDTYTATLKEGGGSIAIVTGLDFQIQNGAQTLYAIGSAQGADYRVGQCNVSGTLRAFFQNGTLLEKFTSGTASSISATITDGTRSYGFYFPNIKYTGGNLGDIANEQEITLELPFQALYDSSEATAFKIKRATS